MRAIAIDWSGDARNSSKKIWLAEAEAGELVRLECGRARDAVAEHLIALKDDDPRFVVGLDFAFSLPAWYLLERGWRTAHELWALASDDGDTWLAQCEPPFWGRANKKRPFAADDPRHLRATDLDVPATAGIRPKSPFQIGGAGAVGTASLRGMPLLHKLHAAGFSIWPFDPPGWPRVVEIYPRLLTGVVNKSRRESREAYLAERRPYLAPRLRALAVSSEDAFDAAVSALAMARHIDELAALDQARDPLSLLEGAIWHPRSAQRDVPSASAAV